MSADSFFPCSCKRTRKWFCLDGLFVSQSTLPCPAPAPSPHVPTRLWNGNCVHAIQPLTDPQIITHLPTHRPARARRPAHAFQLEAALSTASAEAEVLRKEQLVLRKEAELFHARLEAADAARDRAAARAEAVETENEELRGEVERTRRPLCVNASAQTDNRGEDQLMELMRQFDPKVLQVRKNGHQAIVLPHHPSEGGGWSGGACLRTDCVCPPSYDTHSTYLPVRTATRTPNSLDAHTHSLSPLSFSLSLFLLGFTGSVRGRAGVGARPQLVAGGAAEPHAADAAVAVRERQPVHD